MSEKDYDGCTLAALGLAAIPVGIICNGLALVKLWGWFVVTAFPVVPVIDLGQAVGLTLVAAMFNGASESKSDGAFEATVKIWADAVLRPAFLVGFGLIYLAIFF